MKKCYESVGGRVCGKPAVDDVRNGESRSLCLEHAEQRILRSSPLDSYKWSASRLERWRQAEYRAFEARWYAARGGDDGQDPRGKQRDFETAVGTAFLLLWPVATVVLVPYAPVASIALFVLYLIYAGWWLNR